MEQNSCTEMCKSHYNKTIYKTEKKKKKSPGRKGLQGMNHSITMESRKPNSVTRKQDCIITKANFSMVPLIKETNPEIL